MEDATMADPQAITGEEPNIRHQEDDEQMQSEDTSKEKDDKKAERLKTDDTAQYYPREHDVSELSVQERNDLSAMQLRFCFSDANFRPVWTDLSKAGWVYDSGRRRYRPPDVSRESANKDESLLLTAREVAEHLDYGALQDVTAITSDVQQSSKQQNTAMIPRLALGQEERWRRLRDDACYHLFLSNLQMLKEKKDEEKDEEENTENGDKQTATTSKSKKKNTKNNPKLASNQSKPRSSGRRTRSVTEADRGAGQYLNKANIQAKQARIKAKQANATTTTINDENQPPKFERLSLQECIRKMEEYNNNEKEDDIVTQAEESCREQFAEWQFLLATNHSLLVYGFGSKRALLTEFAESHLRKEGYVLALDGFDPEITTQGILSLLVNVFLDGLEPSAAQKSLPGMQNEESMEVTKTLRDPVTGTVRHVTRRKIRDPLDRAHAIALAIAAKGSLLIYLLVHNLEGLKTRLAQQVLSTLVCPSIRLVASFDHVDTPALLWNTQTSAQYRFIWKQVHTYRPYSREL
ncbi:of replication complex subunit 2 (Partial), partial [Seminavis robusta]|eukprot:Sro3605_g349610.1 of replication complex subunit 2 (521) ;mRNA; r:2-1566